MRFANVPVNVISALFSINFLERMHKDKGSGQSPWIG